MNRQQEFLLQLVKEIHEICVRNDIDYYIIGGTLIGAVRNGGFLPWDDDADIAMTYGNWLKFKEACKTQLPDNRYLGSADTSKTYCHLIPRYTSCDTTAIHQCQSLHDDPAGKVVDIFVLDPIGDGKEAYDAYLKDMFLYSLVVNYSNTAGYRFGVDPEDFRTYMKLKHEKGHMAVAQMFEKKLTSHFVDDGEDYIMRWQGVPTRFKREWFSDTVLVPFEDMQLKAPIGYNGMLTTYYGQEWPEVPGVLSPSKHDAASSLDFPYTEALAYFKPKYDRSKLLEETGVRRYTYLKVAPEENEIESAAYAKKVALYAAEVERLLSKHGDEIASALQSLDGQTLAELLKDYMARQTSVDMVGARGTRRFYRFAHPVYIEVPDIVFEGALVAFMQTDRIRKAVRLLQVREANDVPFTPFMERMQVAIARFDAAADAYHANEFETAFNNALALYEDGEVPHPAELIRLICASAKQQWLSSGDSSWRETFEQYLSIARDAYPADGTFAKLQADLLQHDGELLEARELYLRAAESTRNGLALRDIAVVTGYHPSWLRRPKWSIPAGIPRWDGPNPQPLSSSKPLSKMASIEHNGPQQYVLGLLKEVCSLCDAALIPYVLSPKAAQAIAKQGLLPDGVDGYGIVLLPKDVKAFTEAFDAANRQDRMLRFGCEGLGPTHGFAYTGLDSTYLDTFGDYDAHGCLSVSVFTLEAGEYSSKLRALMHYWREGGADEGVKGRMASAYAKVRGIQAHSEESARKLFDYALEETAKAGALHIWHSGELKPFEVSCIENRVLKEVDGFGFYVPEDLDDYLRALPCTKAKRAFQIPAGFMCSTLVPAGELSEYPAALVPLSGRYADLNEKMKAAKMVRTRFQHNFDQIKLAVQVKMLADELIPQKDHIMELHAAGKSDELKTLLAGYRALYKRYSNVGNLEFDDGIYRIMRELA